MMTGLEGWHFAWHCGVEGFAALLPQWQALMDRRERTCFLHQPQWYGCWLSALAQDPNRALFIAARRGGHLQAVMPLKQRRLFGGWGPTVLQTITGPHLNLADFAWPPDEPGLGPAWLRWMQRDEAPRWHVLRLQQLRADSAPGTWLTQRSPALMLSDESRETAWLDCSVDVDHALREVKRSHRQNVRRLMRRAQSLGALRYEAVTSPAQLPAALQAFMRVEASGWKGDAGTAIEHDARHRAFYERLVESFGVRRACRINLLYLDDTVIAAQFALLSGGQLNLLKIGYLQAHAALAPGNLIMQCTVESACADPAVQRLSFVTHPPWAHLWKPTVTTVAEHVVFRDDWLGRALFSLARHHRNRRASAPDAGRREAPMGDDGGLDTGLPVTQH